MNQNVECRIYESAGILGGRLGDAALGCRVAQVFYLFGFLGSYCIAINQSVYTLSPAFLNSLEDMPCASGKMPWMLSSSDVRSSQKREARRRVFMAWLTRSYSNSTGAPCFPGPRETADARVPVGGSSQVFHLHAPPPPGKWKMNSHLAMPEISEPSGFNPSVFRFLAERMKGSSMMRHWWFIW